MQRKLQDLSYAVGNTGVDGKYGPRTTRAVRAFKADYDISTPATKMSAEELRILASAEPKEDPTPVRAPSRGREGGGRRARSALGFFIEKGLSPAQSAGIVGNLQAESGQNLDPSAVGDGGQAHGIAQWHPPRRRNFQRAFGKPFSESSFEEQLEFIWWELNNTERRAMRLLRRAESAEQAAYIFDKYYERSSGAHRRRRMQYAARLLAANPGTAVV
jgi:peptidoglycan hydrolase-like protein with peptidoglycan-binding domain